MTPAILRTSILAGALAAMAMTFGAPSASARDPAPPRLISAGERVAERNCAECHAIGASGSSPYADAPPFRKLRKRYSRDLMAETIRLRMEVVHSRMPKLALDVDEVDEFLDFWEGLPARPAARRRP
jgi:mono/diheme cytochrome c family protein